MWFAVFLLLWTGATIDEDGDGIADALEQKLLEQFVPAFQIAQNDCDVLPSEFVRGVAEPKVVARNGTLYGQAFRVEGGIELHFYHLWANDCGRVRHALDAEHVSALLVEDQGEWRAKYWYAAAHEDTICERGSAARAAVVYAEWRGPDVWVSRGKHGSFLSEATCRSGCGSDRCDRSQRWKPKQIINLGEQNASLNGSSWLHSALWPLREKMDSDFPLLLRGELDQSRRVVALGISNPAVQPVMAAGSTTIDALGTANKQTESALGKAHRSVKDWLKKRLP